MIIKILNLKSTIMSEYQNIKTVLKEATIQIGLKNNLQLKKLKILYQGDV